MEFRDSEYIRREHRYCHKEENDYIYSGNKNNFERDKLYKALLLKRIGFKNKYYRGELGLITL